MKRLFSQNIYKDKWLLIIGIPVITLLSQHIGLSWTTIKEWVRDDAYFPTLLYNLLGIALLFLLNKLLLLWLDDRLPFRPQFRKRLWSQLVLSLIIVTVVGEVHSYLYIYFFNDGEGWESQYITDLPFSILLTVLLNFVYIGFYLQYESREHPSTTPSTPRHTPPQPIEVSIGLKNMLLKQEEVALLLSENKITQVLTLEGKRFVFNHSLKKAQEDLDTHYFFQANRQIIVNRRIIKGYAKLPNRKMELILEPQDIFAYPIYISKEKSPHFLEWLSA